jgi:hypothetical protein
MTEIQFVEGKERKIAFDKLKVFLKNPGMFCLIVVGDRGVGKQFAIQHAFKSIQEENRSQLNEKCLTDIQFKEASSFDEKIDFDKLFEENEFKTLVVEDVDELSLDLQKTLFKALSTTDGRFGIEKKYNLRVLFTSNKCAGDLREDGKYLTGNFWDRISQLIVEFPSYKTDSSTILQDFKATWKKMDFKSINEFKSLADFPGNTKFQKFLDDKSAEFEGGFRDLDKLACLYFNYRIYHYGLKRKIDDSIEYMVVNSVIDDFSSKLKTQNNIENELSNFKFIDNTLFKEMERKFKIQVKQWGKKKYGTIGKAESKLGLGQGTMKNWK